MVIGEVWKVQLHKVPYGSLKRMYASKRPFPLDSFHPLDVSPIMKLDLLNKVRPVLSWRLHETSGTKHKSYIDPTPSCHWSIDHVKLTLLVTNWRGVQPSIRSTVQRPEHCPLAGKDPQTSTMCCCRKNTLCPTEFSLNTVTLMSCSPSSFHHRNPLLVLSPVMGTITTTTVAVQGDHRYGSESHEYVCQHTSEFYGTRATDPY